MNDNQNEFDTIANCTEVIKSIERNSGAAFNSKKSTRTRKTGNQMKLRFHHQALPQEYLEHYEATQNRTHSKEISIAPTITSGKSVRKDRIQAAATTVTSNQNNDSNQKEHQTATNKRLEKSVQMWLQKQNELNKSSSKEIKAEHNDKSTSNEGKVMQKPVTRIATQDLPYMGEITLDNFKPRRGRKPKKADICHLIYKNYGTVVSNQNTPENTTEINEIVKKSPTQHRIISSLLEKRLTSSKRDSANQNDCELQDNKQKKKNQSNDDKPLNLCVRDRYDFDVMTIMPNEDSSEYHKLSDIKSECEPVDSNSNLSRNLKMTLPDFQTALLDGTKTATDLAAIGDITSLNNCENWSNSGIFLNPMALYLQKIANAAPEYVDNQSNVRSSNKSIHENNRNENSDKKKLLVPKKISQLLREDISNTQQIGTANKTQTNSATTIKTVQTPKRKRSAIFIPPLPEESSTNHATEVSICKFKFTGGAKPSLQEKKMLSVDAGGNFRYYSGTGDKSIRGYEFFPRESLQQSSLTACSNAGAFFLNTPGDFP